MGHFRYYIKMLYWRYSAFRMRRFKRLFDSRPADAYSPKWHKLWNLYWRIKKYKPETVVEFGSGCSTIIIGQALYENRKGHLFAYDESEKWKKVTENSLPAHVKNFVTVFYAPKKETEYQGVQGFYFDGDVKHADFVYLDGPELLPDRLVAVDILLMQNRPTYIVVDSRKSNCNFLRQHLSGHAFSFNWLNNQSLFIKKEG
ncbi:MAG: hypothetical protein COU47_00885 [Candidatus Niyogibacteria bacterium CG10_big_fil_rev_8_21_14_0_10_46_36]|uniref:Class I SAM-dependent methyltransferase n=1 Tax=Candidatus Niyogibacteria bacterium CG10_big_fil_rev_8_21_14_0_10_46_36 TaxID=1974726 RepID=A0A2H0TEK7_9BACT|nr:MAG: hypothetical protein COU47_00885 [Candidatus Niyogibacteria bacterium CG10_big_fil_rev_8_21_14_0_10_46_36]